ncbi:MAG: transketolase [Spirochaetes bacterium]|nr:transketolase [Spirochaetota bacterium]
MGLTKERKAVLEGLCKQFRRTLLDTLYSVQTGHPGGSLSATEIITTLYFEVMKVDPKNPTWEDRDRFVLAKGHAAPMLYIALAEKGFFPKEELKTLRQLNSRLQGHPCALKTPGVEPSTGPLGLGLSAALGMGLGAKIQGKQFYTYVLLGDGEIQEGIVWEAAMAGAKYGIDNVVAILDKNGVQLDGPVDQIMPLGDVKAKWNSFGWNTLEVNGHKVEEIYDSIQEAHRLKGKPTIIIAHTVKGKGVSFMEGKHAWHGKPISKAEYEAAIQELEGGR